MSITDAVKFGRLEINTTWDGTLGNVVGKGNRNKPITITTLINPIGTTAQIISLLTSLFFP